MTAQTWTLEEYAQMLVDQYADEGEDLSLCAARDLARFREATGDISLVD